LKSQKEVGGCCSARALVGSIRGSMAGDEPCAKSDAVRSTFAACAKEDQCTAEGEAHVGQHLRGPLGVEGLVERLRQDIMVDLEALLDRRSSTLLREGSKELGKIHEEREQVGKMMEHLSERQDILKSEQVAMHSAIAEITAKLDFFSGELWQAAQAAANMAATADCQQGGNVMEAVSSLPPVDSLGTYGAAAPLPFSSVEGMCDGSVADAPPGLEAIAPSPACVQPLDAAVACAASAAESLLAAAKALPHHPGQAHPGLQDGRYGPLTVSDGPRTPPRPTSSQTSQMKAAGSPAVKLSLESALSSSIPAVVTTPAPARLNIADCLDMDTPPSVPFHHPAPGFVANPSQAPGKMRAEAPAFVPGVL